MSNAKTSVKITKEHNGQYRVKCSFSDKDLFNIKPAIKDLLAQLTTIINDSLEENK